MDIIKKLLETLQKELDAETDELKKQYLLGYIQGLKQALLALDQERQGFKAE